MERETHPLGVLDEALVIDTLIKGSEVDEERDGMLALVSGSFKLHLTL